MRAGLFGQGIEEKKLTPVQRMASRQAGFAGRDLYTTEPADIERFLSALKRDGIALSSQYGNRRQDWAIFQKRL